MEDTNTQWHLGLKPAVDLELAKERANLSYFREYNLNHQALEIDLLIIKKESDQPITNEIGKLFRKYNIIEYKSPADQLNVDTFYKAGAYASLYKAYGNTVDEPKADEITISLIRKSKPVKLFQYFEDKKITIKNPYKGIYYIMDEVLFPTQIIVTKEMDPKEHIWLTALSDGMNKHQLKELLEKIESFDTKLDRELADAVLGVAIKANWQIAQELRGDGNMCQALLELMEPEINKIKASVEAEAAKKERQKGISGAVVALRLCGQGDKAIKNAIMKAYSISDSEAEGYL